MSQDDEYLQLLLKAIQTSANYRPKFGQGRKGGWTLDQFTQVYSADPFYSWFGLDMPIVYAAHRAAGGLTSVYRQIGIGCQWVLNRALRDSLGLSETDANWSYSVPKINGKEQRLSLDGRIVFDAVNAARKPIVDEWLNAAASALKVERAAIHNGAVFEVRQGYKSKDSKRQNADLANAANAYAYQYLPVVILLSDQIDSDVAQRYIGARWLVLRGTLSGIPLTSTYVFYRDVIGYDLAGFFSRNSPAIKKEIGLVVEKLLSRE
ncbi:MAG TPA: hypothetical protein VKT52_10435 [Ktedonobacterales bacterium]|nr:hypothetical protein [Ktedonobacterales bacterium]